jgi:hypothetical protein
MIAICPTGMWLRIVIGPSWVHIRQRGICVSTQNGLGGGIDLRVGDPGPPFFLADSRGVGWSPLAFKTAGRPVLVLFDGGDSDGRASALSEILSPVGPLHGMALTIFHIQHGSQPAGEAPEYPGYSYHRLSDPDGDTHRAYGLAPEDSSGRTNVPLIAVVFDPNFRIAGVVSKDNPAQEILACLEAITETRAVGQASPHAPVLVIPRLLDASECRRGVDLWRQYDGEHKGNSYTEMDERSETFLKEYGAMEQYLVEGNEPQAWLDSIIAPRVIEEISKAFGTCPTNRESYGLLCYDSNMQGHVLPHRDCAAPETTHRRFTVSVLLNDDYEGGELRFSEYSDEGYKMPRGFAVVYSSAILHEVLPVTAGERYAIAFHLYGTEQEAASQLRCGCSIAKKNGGLYGPPFPFK